MAKRYDNVPWTPIEAYPEKLPPKPPCGFVLDTYKLNSDSVTHYRFIPECGNYEIETLPDLGQEPL